MKTSTLFTAIFLIGVMQCAFSLKCYLCTSRDECRRPEIEICKYDEDVCLNVKVYGQSIAKGCVPHDLNEKSFMQTLGMVLSSDYSLLNKLAIDNQSFQELKEADRFACKNRDFCNSADGFKNTAFLSFGLAIFAFLFV